MACNRNTVTMGDTVSILRSGGLPCVIREPRVVVADVTQSEKRDYADFGNQNSCVAAATA